MSELALDPGSPLDADWIRRALASSVEDRERLLERVDDLLDGDEGEQTLALEVLRALFPVLDPTTQRGSRRILWFAQHADDAAEDRARRDVDETEPGTSEGAWARLRCVMLLRTRGGSQAGIAMCREILDLRPDRAIEASALYEFAMGLICLHRAFEASVVCRRLLERVRETGDREFLAAIRMSLAASYSLLEDWGRYDEISAALDADLAHVTPVMKKAIRTDLAILRTDTAARRGDLDETIRRLDVLAETRPSVIDWTLALRALVHVRRGDHPEARKVLDEAGSRPAPLPWLRPWLVVLRLLTDVALDPPEDWRDRVTALLDGAVSRQPDFCLAEEAGVLGLLAKVLEERGFTEEARRAYGGVATKVIEALRHSIQTWEDRPGFLELDAEDRRTHSDHVRRLRQEHEDVSGAVSILLLSAFAQDDPEIGGLYGEDDLLHVCAWCGRVRTGDGRWIPVGPDLPVRAPFQATHGVCADCREDMKNA